MIQRARGRKARPLRIAELLQHLDRSLRISNRQLTMSARFQGQISVRAGRPLRELLSNQGPRREIRDDGLHEIFQRRGLRPQLVCVTDLCVGLHSHAHKLTTRT